MVGHGGEREEAWNGEQLEKDQEAAAEHSLPLLPLFHAHELRLRTFQEVVAELIVELQVEEEQHEMEELMIYLEK